MRIIFIGDPHGRDTWKKIIEKEVFDLVIFAGDYVSTHEKITEEEQIENLKDILKYKEENPDKVILLRGNHDLQHLGYYWAECSGLFHKVLDYMSKKDVKHRFLNDTQWVYIHGNIIFSHAGISKTWLKDANCPLEKLNKLNASEKFGFSPGSDNIFDNHGNSIYQPLTWIRPQALMKDAIDKYIQVVGHTPVTKITNLHEYNDKVHIWLCDALPYEYLVVECFPGGASIYPKYVDKPVIPLHNRYHINVYLENVEDDKWVLKGDDMALNYIGISFLEDHIYSVDPEGGPYLGEGETIAGKKITSIKESPEGYILTLEDEGKKD